MEDDEKYNIGRVAAGRLHDGALSAEFLAYAKGRASELVEGSIVLTAVSIYGTGIDINDYPWLEKTLIDMATVGDMDWWWM